MLQYSDLFFYLLIFLLMTRDFLIFSLDLIYANSVTASSFGTVGDKKMCRRISNQNVQILVRKISIKLKFVGYDILSVNTAHAAV